MQRIKAALEEVSGLQESSEGAEATESLDSDTILAMAALKVRL